MFLLHLFVAICSTVRAAAALTVQTTPNYYDQWCENNCSSLEKCSGQYGQNHTDLRLLLNFPIDDGPGKHLVFDKYFGNTVNRQSFETQFVLDIATALDTSPCRVYVLDVSPKGTDSYWDSENVFVTFRLFPCDTDAVANLTKQIQEPKSSFYQGKVTKAADSLYGLTALKWDFSLKLTYSISIVGGDDVIEPPEHEKYLNQGSLRSCSDKANSGSLYCRFEHDLVEDMETSLGLQRGQFVVLFMKEADRNAVAVSFRLVPDSSISVEIEDWIGSTVSNLIDQISNQSSQLYKGNVSFKIDPTWGISGKSKQPRQFTQFLSRPIPSTSHDAYERCKATHRCPRAWSNYNQTAAQTSHTSQQFKGGKHTNVDLFYGFEDWRRGIRSWKQSCRNGAGGKCLPETESEQNYQMPIGAHFSPFDFESLGQRVATYGRLFNSGLVLNQQELQRDIKLQRSLIRDYESLVDWLDQEYIHAVAADVSLRTREEIRANITNYTDSIAHERQLLQTLSTSSQCIVNCTLLFNTSSAILSGAVNALGVIAKTSNGTEVVIWAFDSIDIDEKVNVTLTGQRAMVILSRSSVRLNTTLKAVPGTLGGFPGGFSVSRRPEDRLNRVCLEQADERQFLDICHGKQCCPGDQSISTLTKGVVSNNVNGPGSPSSRVYLFTIQTSAPAVHEVMSLKTSADIGQTLSGGFRLHFNTCGVLVVQETFCREFSTPFLPHDISAIGLKSKMEASLNPSSRLKQIDRSGTPIGIGTVEVTRERLGTSGGFHWKITFTSAVGSISKGSGRITVHSELVSKGASASIETVQYGNSIGGAFSLQFLGNQTRQIHHDASARELREILLQDIPAIETVNVLRNDGIANCNDGFCYNGPDQSGGYLWTLTVTTDEGNISPYYPTSNDFDNEGDIAEMTAQNNLSGCVDSKCPQIEIKVGHAKSHNKEMRGVVTDKPFSVAYGGAGAGYAGLGGIGFGVIGAGEPYGDAGMTDLVGGSGGAAGAVQPFQLALFKSPRGRGGSGGGAIEIVAANDIIVGSYGALSFDGEPGADDYQSAGGGGSGGSILLSAGGGVQIKGRLSVVGGSGGYMKSKSNAIGGGHGGGGSGGRIALYGESVVIEDESSLTLNGGSCSDKSRNNCTGGDGSLFVKSALETGLVLDHTTGAEGTSSSLYLHARTIRSAYNPLKSLAYTQSGPEYDFKASIRPDRVAFYLKTSNSTNDGWDAMIELRESRWSYLASKKILDYTAVIGLGVGREIRHGANYVGAPFTDEHVKNLTVIHPIVHSNTWTKVDIRLDWKQRIHNVFINDTRVVHSMPFRGDGIRAISISNFFEGDGVWLDEIFVGDDKSMNFYCPVVQADGTVYMQRPFEKGWKGSDIGRESSTLPMQRHTSHVSDRALYQRETDLFIAPFDGEEKTFFHSDIQFKTDHGDRDLKPAKFHAGSILKLPRGGTFDKVFLSNRIGSNRDTYFWYGEHDFDSSGAVMACSTQDHKTWKYEGAMLHYINITDMVYGSSGPFHIEKPKVLYNDLTRKYVMWMIIDNESRDLGLAGVAVSDEPDGPFEFVRSFYPDGNQTRDQTLIQDNDGSAYLFRTFYQTVDYVMPEAVMQPTWESVKNADGSINFALSRHRAEYEPGYDDYHDIYLQRWRTEDKPWKVVCINRLTKEEREVPYGHEYLNYDGDICHHPFEYKVVLGQGNPTHENSKHGIRTRFLDPNDPANNVWIPDSVPNVKGQTWKANYEDGTCGKRNINDDKHHFDPMIPFREEPNRGACSNIVDNPIHPTTSDKRIGPATVVKRRRAKYVAISKLTDDYLDTNGIVTTYEGGLEEGADLLSLARQFITRHNPFEWHPSDKEIGTTFQAPIHDGYFTQIRNQDKAFHQFETLPNDRSTKSTACVFDGTCINNFADQVN